MREKAEQGTYPGRAPYGYINNKGTRAIEIHPQNAEIARYVFERYAIWPTFAIGTLERRAARVGHTYLENQPAQDAFEPVLHRSIQMARAHVPGHASDIHQSRFICTCPGRAARSQ